VAGASLRLPPQLIGQEKKTLKNMAVSPMAARAKAALSIPKFCFPKMRQ
jgi:hypothetical protein